MFVFNRIFLTQWSRLLENYCNTHLKSSGKFDQKIFLYFQFWISLKSEGVAGCVAGLYIL